MTIDNQGRILCYRLLASVCAAPVKADLLETLAAIKPQQFDAKLAPAWSEVVKQAKPVEVSILDDEFHRLFIGVGRGELLPYWSFYQTGFLMDKPLVRLRNYLQRMGFQRQPGNCESEDHIGAMFEVMALLINEENNSQQKDFFNHFLVSWAGRFYIDMANLSNAPFYTAIANLGSRFIQLENSLFSG